MQYFKWKQENYVLWALAVAWSDILWYGAQHCLGIGRILHTLGTNKSNCASHEKKYKTKILRGITHIFYFLSARTSSLSRSAPSKSLPQVFPSKKASAGWWSDQSRLHRKSGTFPTCPGQWGMAHSRKHSESREHHPSGSTGRNQGTAGTAAGTQCRP